MRLLLVGFLLLPMGVWAQTPVKNPSAVAFVCPDHAGDDEHEIDIVREADGVVIQTLSGGDPPENAQGEVEIAINVQPVAFGEYRFVVRALAGTLSSNDSVPSDLWERVPGQPTGVAAR